MRKLVRKPDAPDPRDQRYIPLMLGALSTQPPTRVDLTGPLPSAWDQGENGCCGPNAASAFMCLLKNNPAAYSRQQIYYCTRLLENDTRHDNGVQTRDLFKMLQNTGAAPESIWAYTADRLFTAPPANVLNAARNNVIGSYSRLVGEDDMVACLAEGFSFVLGFMCFESFESDDLTRTGVMSIPDVKREKVIGGHDALVVGYDLKFRSSAAFKNSGVDSTLVSDHALLVRNSWGTDWGIRGHFWMPVSYATNPSIGGDAWTGRL